MTTYINTETSAYPLHFGDAPNGVIPVTWVEVEYSEPPLASKGQISVEGLPLFVGGKWVRQWSVRDLTEEERTPTMFMPPHEQREYEKNRLAALQEAETKKTLDAISGGTPDVIG